MTEMGYDHRDPPLMECGHAANATWNDNGTPRPSCAICAGIGGRAGLTVADGRPSLDGRKARCTYNQKNEPNYKGTGRNCRTCGGERDSEWGLAFFEYRPHAEFDLFYCGCWGWD